MTTPFVPAEFDPPLSHHGPGFRLEPLGAQHNDRDFEAWMSSIDHIRSTPGFEGRDWPAPMSLEENLADLVRHARDFKDRTGFTYSILDGDDAIGCLYIYPARSTGYAADVRSWVKETRGEMDGVVWEDVTEWLGAAWPFQQIEYAERRRGSHS